MELKIFVIIYFVINFVTFITYGIDKRKAVKDRWRIKESTLLLMGALFGGVGQILGMRVFHHKTHKWYFWLCGIASCGVQFYIIYQLFRLGFIK